eukprot:gene19427-biopygen13309
MAKMNPGLDVHGHHPFNPPLTGKPSPGLIDYIVKQRLFNFFLNDGCIPLTKDYALTRKQATIRSTPSHDEAAIELHRRPGGHIDDCTSVRKIVTQNTWHRPIAVYGYDDTYRTTGRPSTTAVCGVGASRRFAGGSQVKA